MRKTFISLFLLLTSYVFPAKIGFVHPDGHMDLKPAMLKTVFEKGGHTIEPTTYKNAHMYDLLIAENRLTKDPKIAKKTILLMFEPKILYPELYNKNITRKKRQLSETMSKESSDKLNEVTD